MASRKIAFIGSHGIRKTTAAHGFLHEAYRQGLTPGFVAEVVRDCPLPINEGLTSATEAWSTWPPTTSASRTARIPVRLWLS